MKGVKHCNKGHAYQDDLDLCPFCIDDEISDPLPNKSNNIKTRFLDLLDSFKQSNFNKKINKFQLFISEKLSFLRIKDESVFSFLKSKYFYMHFLLASITSFFLFYSLLLYIDYYTMHGKEFKLRDFKSLSFNEVKGFINDDGLKMDTLSCQHTSIDKFDLLRGQVLSQEPTSGTFVKKGRKIYFTFYCDEKRKIDIPYIFDLDIEEAKTLLQNEKFVVNFSESTSYTHKNSVVSRIEVNNEAIGRTQVKNGYQLDEGTTITLFVEIIRGDVMKNLP